MTRLRIAELEVGHLPLCILKICRKMVIGVHDLLKNSKKETIGITYISSV